MEAPEVAREIALLNEAFRQGFVVEADYVRRRSTLGEQQRAAAQIAALTTASFSHVATSDDHSTSATTPTHTERFDLAGPAFVVLKRIHPDLAMAILQSFLYDVLETLTRVADELPSGSEELTDDHIRTAVEKVLPPGELASRALAEGAKAISRYRASLAAAGGAPEEDFGEDLANDGEADLARHVAQLRAIHVATATEQVDDEEDT